MSTPRVLVVSLFLPTQLSLSLTNNSNNNPLPSSTSSSFTTTTTTTTENELPPFPLSPPHSIPNTNNTSPNSISSSINSSSTSPSSLQTTTTPTTTTNTTTTTTITEKNPRRLLPPTYIQLPSLLERLTDKSATPNLEQTANVTGFYHQNHLLRPPHSDFLPQNQINPQRVFTGVGVGGSVQLGSDDARDQIVVPPSYSGPVSPPEVRRVRDVQPWPIKPIFPASPSGRKSELQEPTWPSSASESATATPAGISKLCPIPLASGNSPVGAAASQNEDAQPANKSGLANAALFPSRRHRSISRQWTEGLRGSSFYHSVTHNMKFASERSAGSGGKNSGAGVSGHAATSATSLPDHHIHAPHGRRRRESISSSRLLLNPQTNWTVEPSSAGNVGLQNALNSLDPTKSAPSLWIGCVNASADALLTDAVTRKAIDEEFYKKHASVPVWVSDEEIDGHYHHFCKQVLWPTFHYVLPDHPRNPSFEESTWCNYVAVNRKFADTIISTYREGDIIWVHDYHLMLVPSMVREHLPDAVIGFFLHIPFPSSEVFRCLHVRKQVLEGLLGADMVGFQTYPYARHFLQTCTRILAYESSPKGIQLENTFVSVQIFPIGIDTQKLEEKRDAEEVVEIIASLKEKYNDMKLLIGRDKVDHVKGVRQKLLAYERFLMLHPEWVGKAVLIQVALSTTEQNELQGQVCDVAARINSRYGTFNYQPVVYLQQDISRKQYVALLSVADAFLVTSLRDGMNLTSHEFVVCQADRHSPLIISEFTGTYGSFGAAIRVNPWDTRQVANAIHEALTMDEEEKLERWKELYRHVATNTAQHWVESYVSELRKVHADVQRRCSIHIPFLVPSATLPDFRSAKKRLLFLDFDGTLIPYEKTTKHQSGPTPTQTRLTAILKNLVADPRNHVYIMSGRTQASLDQRLGSEISGLGLSAENGCYIKRPPLNTWEALLPDSGTDLAWRAKIGEIFEYYMERTPGSYIEKKDVAMVWHYRMVDNPTYGAWQAAELQNHIEDAWGSIYPIHVVAGNKSLEVMPRNVNKSTAVRRVLDQHGDADFILSIGDDRSDEDMFECLNQTQTAHPEKRIITCTVGSKSSEAGYFVTGVAGVLNCLDLLTGQNTAGGTNPKASNSSLVESTSGPV